MTTQQQQQPQPPPSLPLGDPPEFNFTFHPSVSPYNIPVQAYLAAHEEYDALATGALVFGPAPDRRLLVVQRAAHDSMPGRWETPGGGADLDDASLLHSLARELWEESGLVLRRVGGLVRVARGGAAAAEGSVFFTRRGLRVCKFTFEAEVEGPGEVKLDPNEHQRYLWVTEEECRRGKAKGPGDGEEVELRFTTKDQESTILEGFRVRKERSGA